VGRFDLISWIVSEMFAMVVSVVAAISLEIGGGMNEGD
jgi:hypothetical protein